MVALVLTFSRGAMLGLAAGLGFVALARYRRLLPWLAVAALLLLFLPITQAYVARFVEGFQGTDLATQMRFGEYKDALILIGRYPVFGVGFAGAPDVDVYLAVASVYFTIEMCIRDRTRAAWRPSQTASRRSSARRTRRWRKA